MLAATASSTATIKMSTDTLDNHVTPPKLRALGQLINITLVLLLSHLALSSAAISDNAILLANMTHNNMEQGGGNTTTASTTSSLYLAVPPELLGEDAITNQEAQYMLAYQAAYHTVKDEQDDVPRVDEQPDVLPYAYQEDVPLLSANVDDPPSPYLLLGQPTSLHRTHARNTFVQVVDGKFMHGCEQT
jgi:hypothetical protein